VKARYAMMNENKYQTLVIQIWAQGFAIVKRDEEAARMDKQLIYN
jgi:hypothetical protein